MKLRAHDESVYGKYVYKRSLVSKSRHSVYDVAAQNDKIGCKT